MRTFVIGDVHGQAALLEDLLPRLRERAKRGDALVFIGDYVDRGPDSRRVIELAIAEQLGGWDGPVTTLKGNHEDMMLDAMERRPQYPKGTWMQNGGRETLASYFGVRVPRHWGESLPALHLRFLRGLPSWHRDENGIYVHAGLRPGLQPEECTDDDRLWIREDFIESDHAWDRPVVFGHTPQYEQPTGPIRDYAQLKWRPLNSPEKIGIDTGAAYGGPLTAVILPERAFVQVRPE